MSSAVPTTPTISVCVPGKITFGSSTGPVPPEALSALSAVGTLSFSRFGIDWKETSLEHVFKMDVPGIKKDAVSVALEDGRVLHISGERKRELHEKIDKWHREERSNGQFDRKFTLPNNANVDEIKAAMEDGVLTVTMPKVEFHDKNVIRTIDISS
ncbi:16.9 kDa class I heat shock protein 3-like [Abrus precatorius]|uniref:16.9 kDa class I heat shock protein 3-like n=1 Tax=Abrus precatorius TaxID=3816 RepID=A0A8B8MIU8_ABRPR|nr:16.9 kDa class I heat shock protein 3-like [Abrus precatorius]